MKREIKFRGFSKNNNEWVFGYLLVDSIGCTYIVTDFGCSVTSCSDCGMPSMEHYEVIPETVGQYTGLKDKNGKEIHEGDIVEYEDYSGGLYLFKKQPKARGIISIADLLNGMHLRGLGSLDNGSKVEIIGNIHDNPELLEASDAEGN